MKMEDTTTTKAIKAILAEYTVYLLEREELRMIPSQSPENARTRIRLLVEAFFGHVDGLPFKEGL